MEHCSPLREQLHFNLVAQDPWTPHMCMSADCDSYEIKQRAVYPSMLNLRMATVDRFRNLPGYYLFIDDDLVFKPGCYTYLNSVLTQLNFKTISVYQLFGSRYGPEPDWEVKNCIMTTNRGLFVKASKICNKSDDLLPCIIGGGEDAIIGYWGLEGSGTRVIRGQAPIYRNSINHFKENSESTIHDIGIFNDHARKYIRRRYKDSSWELLSGKLPKGLEE